jgi:hypothetical protein
VGGGSSGCCDGESVDVITVVIVVVVVGVVMVKTVAIVVVVVTVMVVVLWWGDVMVGYIRSISLFTISLSQLSSLLSPIHHNIILVSTVLITCISFLE